MSRQIKPEFAPTKRVVGPMQPPTGPVAEDTSPQEETPSAKAPASAAAHAGTNAPARPADTRAGSEPQPAAGQPATPQALPVPQTDAAEAPSTVDQAAFQPKVYEPGDIACCHQNNDFTNCGAQAGEPCKWQQPGMDGTYHAERVADAAAASQRDGIKPTQEQFDQAAWDSGLF